MKSVAPGVSDMLALIKSVVTNGCVVEGGGHGVNVAPRSPKTAGEARLTITPAQTRASGWLLVDEHRKRKESSQCARPDCVLFSASFPFDNNHYLHKNA